MSAGHEVGRELDALGVHAEHSAQRVDQQRLGEAWDADQQQMAAREQGNEGLIDDILLAINDLADGFAGGAKLATEPFDVGKGGTRVGVGRGRSVGGHQALLLWMGMGLREPQN